MAGTTTRTVWCALVLALGLLTVAGCSNKFTAKTARKNISPSLDTLSLTPEQRKNRHARTVDVNLRQVNEDVDRLLLLDRSTMLNRNPMP